MFLSRQLVISEQEFNNLLDDKNWDICYYNDEFTESDSFLWE